MVVSCLAKGGQCEAAVAGIDADRGDDERRSISGGGRSGRAKKSLAQGEPEVERSGGGGGGGFCDDGDRVAGGGAGADGAGGFEEGARGGAEGAGGLVEYYDERALGLDPLDSFREAKRDAGAPGEECVLDARRREKESVLFRPVGVLQQEFFRAGGGELGDSDSLGRVVWFSRVPVRRPF